VVVTSGGAWFNNGAEKNGSQSFYLVFGCFDATQTIKNQLFSFRKLDNSSHFVQSFQACISRPRILSENPFFHMFHIGIK